MAVISKLKIRSCILLLLTFVTNNVYICHSSILFSKVHLIEAVLFYVRVTVDFGYETSREALPIQQLYFGGQTATNSKGKYSASNVRCGPIPFGE